MQADRLRRAFEAIKIIAAAPDRLTGSQVARSLGLPLSSTHDLLRSLTELHLVDSEDGRYALGPEAVAFSAGVLDGLTVRTRARRHLAQLADRSGEAVYLALPSGRRLIYVDRVLGASRVSIHIRLGEPLYLHSTAAGKLFAALDENFRRQLFDHDRPPLTARTLTSDQDLARELDTIARDKVSITRSESFLGILGLAVPIWAPDGTLAAAIHVSTAEAGADDRRVAELIGMMTDAAARAMADVGAGPPTRLVAETPR